MWKFIKNLFTNQESIRAGQYNRLTKVIGKCYTLKSLVVVRKEIVKYKETWGEVPTYKDLARRFDERIKLVVQLHEKARKRGTVTEETGKAEETL